MGWLHGEFELVVSPLLLAELERALSYQKLRKRIEPQDAARRGAALELGRLGTDPDEPPPVRSRDPGDDYLIALASSAHALLVSGDEHLLELDALPILSPARFLERLALGDT